MESRALALCSPVPKAHALGTGADVEPRHSTEAQPTRPVSPRSLLLLHLPKRHLVTALLWGQLFGCREILQAECAQLSSVM